jgi:hypothetical protein
MSAGLKKLIPDGGAFAAEYEHSGNPDKKFLGNF